MPWKRILVSGSRYHHGGFVLYYDFRDGATDLMMQSGDLAAGQCASISARKGGIKVFMIARDPISHSSGSWLAPYGRDSCYSASGGSGGESYQAAC
ncbi:hypothetical protein ACFY2W_21485 [Streptomyces sp. NPDC001262]|uniref:hypothetical protein n=1 Tax=unclassified Streptomyces TaxID=2593676 RepID=UPI0036A00E14